MYTTPQYSLFKHTNDQSLGLQCIEDLAILRILEEHGIEEDGYSSQNTLLFGGCILWEVHFKGVGFGKDLRHETFWFLQNETFIVVASLISNVWSVDAEGLLAASLSTWISFSTAIDAHSPAADWWMN